MVPMYLADGPASVAGLAAANGQGWKQVGELLLAFALSSVVGLEREFRGKSAGVRTQSIVGTASALMMLVSKYGFGDVVATGLVNLDPSRVAAQIVSGVGFLGAGLIINRRERSGGSRRPPRYGRPPRSGWPPAPGCRCWRWSSPHCTS